MTTLHGRAVEVTVRQDGISGRTIAVRILDVGASPCQQAMMSALERMTALCLSRDVDPAEVQKQLRGIICHPTPGGALSVPDALARSLHA